MDHCERRMQRALMGLEFQGERFTREDGGVIMASIKARLLVGCPISDCYCIFTLGRNGTVLCNSLGCMRAVWFNLIGVSRSIYGGIRITFSGTLLSMLTLISHMSSYKYSAEILTIALQTSKLTLLPLNTRHLLVSVSRLTRPRDTRAMGSLVSKSREAFVWLCELSYGYQEAPCRVSCSQ
jgi:hypothetical protein